MTSPTVLQPYFKLKLILYQYQQQRRSRQNVRIDLKWSHTRATSRQFHKQWHIEMVTHNKLGYLTTGHWASHIVHQFNANHLHCSCAHRCCTDGSSCGGAIGSSTSTTCAPPESVYAIGAVRLSGRPACKRSGCQSQRKMVNNVSGLPTCSKQL